jgi:hypothetical protein
MSIKISINRTRAIQACSAVPQPTAPSVAPSLMLTLFIQVPAEYALIMSKS